MDQLEKTLSDVFSGMPKLPVNIRQVIVSIAPYLAVIGFVLSLPAVLAMIGFGALAPSLVMMGGYMPSYGIGYLGIVFALITTVLYGLAISGLFKRKYSGWKYSFWAVLVAGVQSLLSAGIVSALIGTAIGLYVLFQVRESYR